MTSSEIVGVARLGENRAEVRARLGESRTFRRTLEAPETDYFVEAGVQVTYRDEEVVFIELCDPAVPLFAGVRLLARSIDEVRRDLYDRGFALVADESGALIKGTGIGLYAPVDVVESVSLGE
jgi:hypothetical protein